jgi:DNA polymerase alpha subunit B
VDYAHHEAFEFAKSTPDILILPSYLPAFAKKVEGTLVINPGIVNKRNFAEVTITPGAPNALVADRATAEIFKLT